MFCFFVKIRLQGLDETAERDQRLLRSNGPDNLSSPTDPHLFLRLGLDRLRQIAVITLLNFRGFEFAFVFQMLVNSSTIILQFVNLFKNCAKVIHIMV